MPRKSTSDTPKIDQMPLFRAVQSFFAALPADLSTATVRSKRRTLQILVQVAGGGQVNVSTITKDTLQKTLTRLESGATAEENEKRRLKGFRGASGRSAQSLVLDRSTLRQFIKHCKEHFWLGYWIDVPAPITRSAKATGQAKRDKRIIPPQDFLEILDIAGSIHPRVRMAIAMNLLWARRISEVADARHCYLQAGQETLVAKLRNIKRGRDLPEITVDWGMQAEIDRWLAWITPLHGIPQADWFLVPARQHFSEFITDPARRRIAYEDTRNWPVDPTRQTNTENLRLDIHKVLKTYGWQDTKGEGGHTFRRSGARAFQDRYGLEATQALLDHESPQTTFVYTQNINGMREMNEAMGMGGMLGPRPTRQGDAEIIPFVRRQSAG